MKLLGKYKNGNYDVMIFNDGTKIRETEEDEFIPSFSENCDVKLTDKCKMGCQFCFSGDTDISTDTGIKKIQDIDIGDIVWSYNEKTKLFELHKVIELYKRQYSDKLICLELETGDKIKCTPNHKIFTTNRGWVSAENILETDDIKIYK